MTLTIEIPELIGARIKDNPEGMARAQRALAREFAGIDLDAVEAILESFTQEGQDMDHEEVFARAEAKILARRKVAEPVVEGSDLRLRGAAAESAAHGTGVLRTMPLSTPGRSS